MKTDRDQAIVSIAKIPARARGPFRVISWETSFIHRIGKRKGKRQKAFAVVPSNYSGCMAIMVGDSRLTMDPRLARRVRQLANSGALVVADDAELPI